MTGTSADVDEGISADVDEDFMRRAGRILTVWLAVIILAGVGLIVFSDSFLSTFA